ncbi:MAG: ATP-dependent helicase HrpB [Alphaproteobacteria bacterium]|nr:ATP-dependent helicase HrpB [Alphaproteobacteria bacterium]
MNSPRSTFDLPGLPVVDALPGLRQALRTGRNAVLQAPPGAGKTTLAPLALLDEDWLGGGRILVLEPRRLAARMAARRMAELLGETVGETVGYRVRMDSRVGPRTRIEVVTEGILTRRLIDDPELAGVGAVIFDEFHERSVHNDLGLALCLEVQDALRDDLRLIVMSATLDTGPVSTLLGDAQILASEGRTFPVETRHLDRPAPRDLARGMAAAIRKALGEAPGSVLAFLPGESEIRRVLALLDDAHPGPGIRIAPLFGALPPQDQDAAVRPAPQGVRKIVLATDIAETSLTIEGIGIVIDGGYRRRPVFDVRSGMTRLATRRVSRAGADQRRGRAGRLAPGVCYRLWPEAETAALPLFETPEILEADLAPLALDLARWGVDDPAVLRWPDPPPAVPYARARALLTALGILDRQGRITRHGTAVGKLPAHPRIGHMLLTAKESGHGGVACDLAALLDERDILAADRTADVRARLDTLQGGDGNRVHRGALARVRQAAQDLRRRLQVADSGGGKAGILLAHAYPDRVARRRGARGRFLLRNGRGATLPDDDPLAGEDWLAIAHLGGAQADARVFLAAPLTAAQVETVFGGDIVEADRIAWDDRQQKTVAARERRLGAIVIRADPIANPDKDALRREMVVGIQRMGLDSLPWDRRTRQWQARVLFLHELEFRAIDWPAVSDAALLDSLDAWLGPFLTDIASRDALHRVDLQSALHGLLPWEARRMLDAGAPEHWTAPTGSRLALDYTEPDGPVLRVRLQEMLGESTTPSVADEHVPVLVQLLSPAGRPVQVTRDIAGFWQGSYAQVKADMKGRYPKHYWPDDPLASAPTKRTRRTMKKDE